jgi:hypothetical protein
LARFVAAAALIAGLAPSAFAQIISTSLPTADAGARRDGFSAHIMATPFAKWDYKEVYIVGSTYAGLDFYDLGLINAKPNSKFMAAADLAFALGESNWSLTLGGWYNKIGSHDFDFDGSYVIDSGQSTFTGSQTARIPLDLTIAEGHLGLFYRSVGIQGGIVRTSSKSNGDWMDVVLGGGGPAATYSGLEPFEKTTNDWTGFGVFRTSREQWGFSLGAGAYVKEGVNDSPLRFEGRKIVPSGFVTGNVAVYKGLGVDVSFWYIGKTGEIEEFEELVAQSPSDSQSRFTIGIGYSF